MDSVWQFARSMSRCYFRLRVRRGDEKFINLVIGCNIGQKTAMSLITPACDAAHFLLGATVEGSPAPIPNLPWERGNI